MVFSRFTCDIGAYDTSQAITLKISGPSAASAGVPASFIAPATNAGDGTPSTGFDGMMYVTGGGPNATLPPAQHVPAADLGQYRFKVTFNTVGSQDVEVFAANRGVAVVGDAMSVQVGVAIQPGWNLVNLPVDGTGISTAAELVACMDGMGAGACSGGRNQLGKGAITTVQTYVNGRFHTYMAGQGGALSLSPLQGILVHSMRAGIWTPQGSAFTSPPTLRLQRGLNLVSLPYTKVSPAGGITAGQVAKEATCKVKEIKSAKAGKQELWQPSHPTSSFVIPTYAGVWITCGSSGVLAPH